MTQQTTEKPLLQRIIMWVLGAISSLATYVAIVQNQRASDWKELNAQKDDVISVMTKDARTEKVRSEKEKDSLHGIIINRTDNNFKELKELMNIKSNPTTITIKPKPTK